MPEFMLYVRNIGTHDENWSKDRQQEFLKKCETYIERLKKDGKLISAQPVGRSGQIISGPKDQWQMTDINPADEINVGYYHIEADDLAEAIEIAKQNPEFEYSNTARVEVRPIKDNEQTTEYIYPTGQT